MTAGNKKGLCHALISLLSIGLPNYKKTKVVSQFRNTHNFMQSRISVATCRLQPVFVFLPIRFFLPNFPKPVNRDQTVTKA